MGLLDDLKKQAEVAKQRDRGRSELLEKNTALVEAGMRRSFKYLNDLVNQLNVLKPDSPRAFDVELSGRFEGLKLGDFFIDYRSKKISEKDYLDNIALRFRCASDKELVVQKDSPMAVERFSEYLREHNLQHELQEFKNEKRYVTHGEFKIPVVVRSQAVINADHENAQLHFYIKNIERLGAFNLIFDAVAIDENMLEEFAKFLIGHPNRFRSAGRYQVA